MRRKAITPSPASPEVPVSPAQSTVSEQIARLQQRQLEMVQQTAQELESLKEQLEKSEQAEKLESEVNRLREERNYLEQNVHQLQNQLIQQQEHTTHVVSGLTDVIRTHLQSVQGFTSQTEAFLEKIPQYSPVPLPETTPVAPTPVQEKPVPVAPVILPVQHAPAHPQELLFEAPRHPKKARTFSGRRFALRAVTASLIVVSGYGGWNFIKKAAGPTETGDVAGAAVVASATPEPYAESFADVPFEQTEWEVANDGEFGIQFDYPKNASNRTRTLGGNNLWVLRKNGYLLKISRFQTTDTLETWWTANQKNYTDESKGVKTTFKGFPAIYVESKVKTVTSGSSYFVQRTDGIYQIWIKDESAATDDGQRLTRMMESFTFTN